MKLLITASRKLTDADYRKLAAAIEKHYPTASEILHGGAKGGDQLASRYARENGLLETVLHPDYEQHAPKLAPLLRNTELVKLADATLAVYADKKSGGTLDTATKTLKAGKPLVELNATTGTTEQHEPPQTLF